MKKFMGSILGVFSDDLGIDLGTSNTLICMKNKGIYYAIEFFILIVLVFFLSNKLLYIENKSKIETKKVTNEFLIRQKDFYTKIQDYILKRSMVQ